MKIRRVRLALILSALLTCSTFAHADPFTFSLLPEDGSVSGAAGSTIGWGYTIANPSATDWLWLTTLSADPFLHATADASVFLFPILAPGSSVTVPYSVDAFEGLFQMTWDADAPVGFTNSGRIVLGGEFWSGDPLAGGSFVDFADDQSAAYTATVTGNVSSVPEPGTLLLTSIGALGLLGVRKTRARFRRDSAAPIHADAAADKSDPADSPRRAAGCDGAAG